MTDACLSRQHDCQFKLAIRPTRVDDCPLYSGATGS